MYIYYIWNSGKISRVVLWSLWVFQWKNDISQGGKGGFRTLGIQAVTFPLMIHCTAYMSDLKFEFKFKFKYLDCKCMMPKWGWRRTCVHGIKCENGKLKTNCLALLCKLEFEYENLKRKNRYLNLNVNLPIYPSTHPQHYE